VAVFVLISFTTTSVAWSAPVEPSAPRLHLPAGEAGTTDQRLETRIPSLADNITIPPDLGSIKEAFQPQSSSSGSSLKSQGSGLIIHLEDAHGSVEAQLHEEKILRHMREQHGLETFFVEGGIGDLRPEFLSFSKDTELNGKMIDKLTELGVVGGVERFLAKQSAATKTKALASVPASRQAGPVSGLQSTLSGSKALSSTEGSWSFSGKSIAGNPKAKNSLGKCARNFFLKAHPYPRRNSNRFSGNGFFRKNCRKTFFRIYPSFKNMPGKT
jgi:hypothetical protein